MTDHILKISDLFDKSNNAGNELLKKLAKITEAIAGGSHDSI